jgi:hypothetical protein
MSIDFKIQSVTLTNEQVQEYFPALIDMINSSLPKKKTPKRRKPRRKKETVGSLIQDILADIEQY